MPQPAGSFVPNPRGSGPAVPPLSGPVVTTYRDVLSGCTFVVARPAQQPLLWRAYLDGAVRSYRRHGVEAVLEYDVVIDGASTSLFFVALNSDNVVVGGMRSQGPYTNSVQAHAVAEWDGRQGVAELHDEINARLAEGVIEMKTGWGDETHPRRRELTDALARTPLHAIRFLGVRWAMCTAPQHALRRWQMTGAVVSSAVDPVSYPDQRYRTVLMWWDRENFADLIIPEQLRRTSDESTAFDAVPIGVASDDERISS